MPAVFTHTLPRSRRIARALLPVQVAYCTSAVAFEDGRRPQFEIPYVPVESL